MSSCFFCFPCGSLGRGSVSSIWLDDGKERKLLGDLGVVILVGFGGAPDEEGSTSELEAEAMVNAPKVKLHTPNSTASDMGPGKPGF